MMYNVPEDSNAVDIEKNVKAVINPTVSPPHLILDDEFLHMEEGISSMFANANVLGSCLFNPH